MNTKTPPPPHNTEIFLNHPRRADYSFIARFTQGYACFHNAGYLALSNTNDPQTELYPTENASSTSTEPLISRRNGPRNIRGGSFTFQPDEHTYTYSYGPKGLAGLRHNYYALLCAFFASIGGLDFGYDQGVIANVLVMQDFMDRWPITPLQKGIMTAVLELGALIGALIAGVYADRYSRRHSILLASTIFCIGSAFQCGAQNLSHLFIGRALGGLGVGALSMLCPLYMAEISPPELRGSLMALEQFSIVLGVVFGFWTGFLTRSIPGSLSWRVPLGIQIIPGIILALGCSFLPPSPRLLVLQGRYDEALVSLARLRLRTPEEAESDPLLHIELLEMRVETELIRRSLGIEFNKPGFKAEWKAWKKLFKKKYRDRTMIGVAVMFFQQWSGINALLYYGPTIVQSIGLRGDTVTLLVSGGISIIQFLAVLPAIVLIDRLGRKPLLRGGAAMTTLSHFSIAILVILFESDWLNHPFAAWTAVAGIYTFTATYGVSFGPIAWILPSEVFPLSMRSKGVAFCTASNWLNNFFIGLLTPVMFDFSASATFMTFATACGFAYLWATYIVPETANVSLEEIDSLFGSSTLKEEADVKQEIEQGLGLTDLIREIVEDQ